MLVLGTKNDQQQQFNDLNSVSVSNEATKMIMTQSREVMRSKFLHELGQPKQEVKVSKIELAS